MWKIFLLLLCILSSCHNPTKLDAVLDFAGANRNELEKVLIHYKDSGLKYDAARFLIENMPYYYSHQGVALDSAKMALMTADSHGIISNTLIERWSSPDSLSKIYDAHVISADYIIRNIDHAFVNWKRRSWNKYLSFEDFCELLLPYRIGDEPLEDWRSAYEKRYAFLLDSIYKGTDVIEATTAICQQLKKEGFVYNWEFSTPHLGASFLLDHRAGTCEDACDLTIYVLRALGIPVAIDCYTYSPETRKGHTWNVVRDTTGAYLGVWFTERLPERGKIYSDGRKAGKVFRKQYAAPFYKDVSSEYYSDTLELDIHDNSLEQVYLGVFHPDGWVPIDCKPVMDGKVMFPNIESKAEYILLKNSDDKFVTIGYPFYFDGHSVSHYIPDLSQKETVRLYRKQTLFSWIWHYLWELDGGIFEFSNQEDFSKIEYAYKVRGVPPTCHNGFVCSPSVICRFIRYRAPKGRNTDIAELCFWDSNALIDPVSVKGERPETSKSQIEKAFDKEILSSYTTIVPGATLFMDFGREVEIDSVAFVARNDDNYIRIGDTYELFYFSGKNGWVSLGRKTAVVPWLEYDNMPEGALFHLRCLTRGVEEQVFHVENGKQVFVSNQGVPIE